MMYDRNSIVEKRKSAKKKVLSDNDKAEPKAQEKGWNAFDYMDEEEGE